MRLMITFMVIFLVFFVSQIILDFVLGVGKEKGYLKNYYSNISGIKHTRLRWVDRMLGLNKDQLIYSLDYKKYIKYTFPACLIVFLFSFFFFRSAIFSGVISLIGLFYPRFLLISMINKRKSLLNSQLKEAMFSLSSSLKAGASLQKSIERSVLDLELIFHDKKDAPILIEFRQMAEGLQMGFTVEEVLLSLKERVKLEDIDDMVNSTIIAKNRGGDLTEIFSNIAKTISEKIEIKNEIQTLTAGKRLESRILSLMPIAIVTSLTLLSPQYMSPLYHSGIGRVLMFAGFILIILNYIISRKIIKIEV